MTWRCPRWAEEGEGGTLSRSLFVDKLFLDMDDFRPRFRDKEDCRLRDDGKDASPGTVVVEAGNDVVVESDPGVERRLDVRLSPRFRVGEINCGVVEVEEEERGDRSGGETAMSVATESAGLVSMVWVSCCSRKWEGSSRTRSGSWPGGNATLSAKVTLEVEIPVPAVPVVPVVPVEDALDETEVDLR